MNAPYSLCKRSLLCSAVLLTLAACGGSGSDEKQTTTPPVTETPQNQAPQISGQSQTLRVGETLSFSPEVSDPDNDPLTLSVTNLPSWLSFNEASASISGTPEQAGKYANIEFTVTDGQLSAQLLIDINVEAKLVENTPPTLTSTPSDSNEGQAYTYQLTFTDAQNDTVVISEVSKPDWLSFDATNLSFSGTPLFANTGEQQIRFRYSDGEVTQQAEQTFNIAARANSAPVVSPLSSEVRAEKALSVQLISNDADNDDVSLTVIGLPTWLSFDEQTSILSGTASNEELGEHKFTITASDSRTETSFEFVLNITQSYVAEALETG